MTHIEILVEERSITPVLDTVLGQLLTPSDSFAIREFGGKPDLLRKLPSRLRGYNYRTSDPEFVVLVILDRDDEDCLALKQRVIGAATDTNLVVKQENRNDWNFVVRVAIEELESWLFGDWEAVRAAFPRVAASIPKKAPYRQPDEIQGGTAEALERVLSRAGYQNVASSKTFVASQVAPNLRVERNSSPSFRTFCIGVTDALKREVAG